MGIPIVFFSGIETLRLLLIYSQHAPIFSSSSCAESERIITWEFFIDDFFLPCMFGKSYFLPLAFFDVTLLNCSKRRSNKLRYTR